MNSSQVIVFDLSVSILLKKSCNSAGDNSLLRAMDKDNSSFFSIVLLLFLSNWLNIYFN